MVFDEGGAEVEVLSRELRNAFDRSIEDILLGTAPHLELTHDTV